MIKLIVSDLDGTLLDIPNAISEENLEAIRYACERGAKFCFATGRDMASIAEIAETLPEKPLLILGNGAQFYDEEGNLLGEEFFPNQYLWEVVDILKEEGIEHIIFTTDGFYTTKDTEVVREKFIERIRHFKGEEMAATFREGADKPCNNLVEITDYDTFQKEKTIIKVEGFDLRLDAINRAKEKMERFTELSHLSTGPVNVEVTSIYAQKGVVLERYLHKLGLEKEEVMVLGDGDNDLSMFERFPYSFAPSDAVSLVKEKAYRVVGKCEEHAVAQAIYEMFQIEERSKV